MNYFPPHSGKQTATNEMISEINMTPFVDIVLVLLVICFVVAPSVVNQSIKMDLPQASTAEKSESRTWQIGVSDTLQVYLNGQKVDEKKLLAEIEARSKNKPEAFKNDRMLISADKAVPYGNIIRLIDLVRSAGLYQFAIDVAPQGLQPSPSVD